MPHYAYPITFTSQHSRHATSKYINIPDIPAADARISVVVARGWSSSVSEGQIIYKYG